MPLYNYKCTKCDHTFEQVHKMDDRKIPENEPCPACGAEGSIRQQIGTPGFISDSKSPLTRAGSGWKDVLKRVKSGSGRVNSIHD